MRYVITGVSNENSLGSMIVDSLRKFDKDAEIIAVCEPDKNPDVEVDHLVYCNMSSVSETIRIFQDISEHYKFIDVLVNCAGTNRMNWFENVTVEEYVNVMNVNCTSAIFAIQSLLQSLSSMNGTVLNIISMGAHKAFRTSLAYNVSKAAMKMANEQLARELSDKFGITVFGISPNELEGTNLTIANSIEIPKVRGWTNEQAEEYRVKSSGQAANRTDPKALADFIGYLLHKKKNHVHLNGVDLYYGD